MSSTFSGLETAYSGLTAARDALNVTGQNITNAGTDGYTRQRVQAHAAEALNQAGRVALPTAQPGQGVNVTGIARLSDELLNQSVRSASSASSYADTRATVLGQLESTLNEPSDHGISAGLQDFWSSWQDLANDPSQPATAAVVISKGQALAGQIAAGYSAVQSLWSSLRSQVSGLADQVNQAADQIAKLNHTIQQTVASGGSANELMDQRDQLTKQVASLVGGNVTKNQDGTVNVLVGGNILVSGSIVNHVTVTGATDVTGAGTTPVQLEWQAHPGQAVAVDGGQIAADINLLAPSGSGGVLASAADQYNQLATALATQVNALTTSGQQQDGTAGGPFFAFSSPTAPAALSLTVVPTDPSQVVSGAVGAGTWDGSVADKISQIGASAGSPDQLWSQSVSSIATSAQQANQAQTVTGSALQAATSAQQANSSVDTDQENLDMVTEQAAYQAAARVMTTVDQMLDTLINHTGVVGL